MPRQSARILTWGLGCAMAMSLAVPPIERALGPEAGSACCVVAGLIGMACCVWSEGKGQG